MPVEEDSEQGAVRVTDRIAAMTIGKPSASHDGWVDFLVTISAEGLSASRSVTSLNGGPQNVLGELATDWRGDTRDQRWESTERDFILEARRTLGSVKLIVTLRESTKPDGWAAEVTITVEAGEEMSNFAAAVNNLFDNA